MADTTTTNLSLTKPQVDVEDVVTDWGDKMNADLDTLDAKWASTTPSSQAVGDAASAGSDLHVARADHKHAISATVPSIDVTLTGAGKGVVVTTPDGAHTYRIAISNNGELTTELIS